MVVVVVLGSGVGLVEAGEGVAEVVALVLGWALGEEVLVVLLLLVERRAA